MKKLIKNIIFIGILSISLSQTTITTDDLRYDVGGYYSMYNFPSPQGVIGLTGNVGGPYVFDFQEGVTATNIVIEYVDANDQGHGGSFPQATIAEKRRDENGDNTWMYLDFVDGAQGGRRNFGFYDDVSMPTAPSVVFNPPIMDFPNNLTYQSYFSGTTGFTTSVGGYSLDIEYSFEGFADAYGTVILPDGLGEHECIQINYSEQFTYYLFGTPLQYTYIRSYYYLAEDLGIVAIITSNDSQTQVPNDFNIASTFARLYDTSKTTSSPGDLNEDEQINVLDVVAMVNLILSGEYIEAADMNGDGVVNVLDIVVLVNIILG